MAEPGKHQEEDTQTIVLFPFLAQGHIIPFLALALRIDEQNTSHPTNIILVNTPLNVAKLKPSIPPTSSIRLLEFPFDSSSHGLPPDTENTDSLPYPLIIRLLQAANSLEPAFRTLLEGLNPRRLCVVADVFFGWTGKVARELGVFHVIFSGSGGYGLACYYSCWRALPHRRRKDGEGFFELEDFEEAKRIHVTQLPLNILVADGTDPWSVFQGENFSGWEEYSDGILINTVEDFDRPGMDYFRRKLGRPAWAVGPVLLSAENRGRYGKKPGVDSGICKGWLDDKPEHSVVYVSFGSNNTIAPSQMIQLALALESSGRYFIWVVRPPVGFDIKSEFRTEEWLPPGFEERVRSSGSGLLVHGWAPQVEILAHKSVGAFLSHCGWNSVLESLDVGVPILGWAMAGEQFFNVKFLVEDFGVCVEVARGRSCEVRHEDIRARIEEVMDESGPKGKEIRRRALEVKEMIREAIGDDRENGRRGSSLRALDDFLEAAISGRKMEKA